MQRHRLAVGLVGLIFTVFLLGTAARPILNTGPLNELRQLPIHVVSGSSTTDLIEFATGLLIPWQIPTAGAEVLAWSASYALQADVELYLATGDGSHLARAVQRARELMDRLNRDKQGRALGWQQSNGSMTVVHQGILAYAVLRVLIAPQVENVLPPTERSAWGRDLTDVLSAPWIEKTWRDDSTGSFYMGFENPTFNVNHSMGRALLLLSDLTGNLTYRNRAAALAATFRRYLLLVDEHYEWPYGLGYEESYPEFLTYMEDVSHGAIDVDFARMAYERGVVFQRSDMQRFARTLLERVMKDGQIAVTVEGGQVASLDPAADYRSMLRHWVRLSQFDPQVAERIRTVVSEIIVHATLGSPDEAPYFPQRPWTVLLAAELARLEAQGTVPPRGPIPRPGPELEPLRPLYAHYRAGLTAKHNGNWADAATELGRALELAPDGTPLQRALAAGYDRAQAFADRDSALATRERGDLRAAVDLMAAAVQRLPTDWALQELLVQMRYPAGDRARGSEVSASANVAPGSSGPAAAVDGADGSTAASVGLPAWLEVRFPEPQTVGRIVIRWHSAQIYPKQFRIQVQTGDGWRDLRVETNWRPQSHRATYELELSTPVQTLALRLLVERGHGQDRMLVRTLSVY